MVWVRLFKLHCWHADCFILFIGYYLLANTKFTSQPGYIGRLYGPTLPGNLQYCLRFHYSIYGFFKMSDTLAVYIFEENHMVQEKIWSVMESPRGIWMQAEISFKKPMPTKVPWNQHSPLFICSYWTGLMNFCLIIFNWWWVIFLLFKLTVSHPHAVPSHAQFYPSVLSSFLCLRIMATWGVCLLFVS